MSTPPSGIVSIVLVDSAGASLDHHLIGEFDGFQLESLQAGHTPLLFSRATSALRLALQTIRRHPESGRCAVVTMEMDQTADEYDAAAIAKAEALLEGARPGQIVVSSSTREVLGIDPPDFELIPVGRFMLPDVWRAETLYVLRHPELRRLFSLNPEFCTPLNNLPRMTGKFVGREADLEEIEGLTFMARTVVLLGASGIGKTRLAVSLGEKLLASQNDGVWYADLRLAPASLPLLASHIMSRIGVDVDIEKEPLDCLADHFRPKEATIILDSCEAVTDATCDLVQTLLEQCPNLQFVLATQSSLRLKIQSVHRVRPLSIEMREDGESDAIELFMERALVVDPDFDPNDEETTEITEICEILDGIPLAIELAAAAYVSEGQIELSKNTERSATHRVLEWLDATLTTTERSLAEACGTFRGPVETAIAFRISEVGSDREVRELIEKNVLRIDGDGTLRMPRGVQSYFANSSRQNFQQLLNRHSECFTELAEEADKAFAESGDIKLYTDHLDNFHQALEWHCTHHKPEQIVRLVYALFDYWHRSGRMREGLDWIQRSIDASMKDVTSLARLKNMGCALSMSMGDLQRAKELADEAISLSAKLDFPALVARLYMNTGLILWAMGQIKEALAAMRACRDKCRRLNENYGYVLSCLYIASLTAELGQYKEAEKQYQNVHQIGLPEHSAGYLELHMGFMRIMQDRNDDAKDLLEKAFCVLHDHDYMAGICSTLRLMVPVWTKLGLASEAAIFAGKHDTINRSLYVLFHARQKKLYDDAITQLRANLGEAAYQDLHLFGAHMSLDSMARDIRKDLGDLAEL